MKRILGLLVFCLFLTAIILTYCIFCDSSKITITPQEITTMYYDEVDTE